MPSFSVGVVFNSEHQSRPLQLNTAVSQMCPTMNRKSLLGAYIMLRRFALIFALGTQSSFPRGAASQLLLRNGEMERNTSLVRAHKAATTCTVILIA